MSLQKASPVDLRKALEIANVLIRSGIDFVPVIVESKEQKQRLIDDLAAQLDNLEKEAKAL